MRFVSSRAIENRFETGLPQTYAWTLLSPYIKSCPPNNPRIEFTRFPLLNVTNQPSALEGTLPLLSLTLRRTLTSNCGLSRRPRDQQQLHPH